MGTNRTAKAALFLLIILCVACQTTPTIPRHELWAKPEFACGLKNLFEVDKGKLYRSAQIENMCGLITLGIKTNVNLRNEDPDSIPPQGVCNIRLPLNPMSVSEEDVIKFLQIARDPAHHPVLVHCVHGSDRTGVMVAAYRMVEQNWSIGAATNEMLHGNYGFHSIFVNLPVVLRDMDVDRVREASNPPASPGGRKFECEKY